jgi:hypothetical protein
MIRRILGEGQSVEGVRPALVSLMQPGSSIILNTSWPNQVGTPGRSLLSA